jgi:hypothetical protein
LAKKQLNSGFWWYFVNKKNCSSNRE